jgi:uncharacterized membrane protein
MRSEVTMGSNGYDTVICEICGKAKQRSEVFPAELVRPIIGQTIQKTHESWGPGKFICLQDLNHLRSEHVENVLQEQVGELTDLEDAVVRSLREQELLSTNINTQFERKLTFGEHLADRVAEFGGSWKFMITFGCVMVLWISINSYVLVQRPFDPFPFILLNLVLSCLAAIQAPVIMMSQNRQEAKDRLRSENDYRVNLKAELEIRHVNAKVDLLLTHQWRRLMEIQQIQLDLMEELVQRRPSEKED